MEGYTGKIEAPFQLLKQTSEVLETKLFWDSKDHTCEKVFVSEDLYITKILPSSNK
jgi:hypothetical protein